MHLEKSAIGFGDPRLIAKLLDEWPALRWVQSTWAGVAPLVGHPRRDYQLTGVKGIFGAQMTEYVAAHLLAISQRLPERAARQSRREWWPRASETLAEKSALVLGTGSIGAEIARRLNLAFGVRCTGFNSDGRMIDGFGSCIGRDELNTALEACDFVINTLPDTVQTRGLLGGAELAALQPHVVFLNVGRANVVDTEALCSRLKSGLLAGAVLDVFDAEPLAADSAFWSVPRLTITAHIAALTSPAAIAPLFFDNLSRFLAGKALRAEVDFERGY